MLISIHTHLVYSARQPCSLLLQIEAAQDGAQTIESATLTSDPNQDWTIISGEENIGLRRWTRVDDLFDCTYQTHVNVTRPAVVLETLNATPYAMIPSDGTKFLMPSRYCFPEDFLDFAPQYFGHLSGGPLIAAMARWITNNFTYDNSASHAATTATDSFRARAGVCRDYAHVMIAMARSVGIPARFVSAYAPDVTPQDFHAVAEVYLDGAWHLIDPTGMAQAPEIVRIGVGRDAADVSFMTSYGWMELIKQAVHVARVD